MSEYKTRAGCTFKIFVVSLHHPDSINYTVRNSFWLTAGINTDVRNVLRKKGTSNTIFP